MLNDHTLHKLTSLHEQECSSVIFEPIFGNSEKRSEHFHTPKNIACL